MRVRAAAASQLAHPPLRPPFSPPKFPAPAGHRIKEPCTKLDLCAGVSCPAIDECHTDGVCVAGLCTTPKKEGACGVTAFVAQPVLAAAAECPGAVEVDALSIAIPDRKEKLGELRRSLSATAARRALSVAKAPAADEASTCDPRTGVCPGYDQMFCSEPFALNYRETAVYATHCCSELNSMSIFYQTSSVRNKVMVKYHKMQDEFVFQAGGGEPSSAANTRLALPLSRHSSCPPPDPPRSLPPNS